MKPIMRKVFYQSILIRTNIDSLTQEPLHYDWETLRHEIKEFGLRNSTLTALMPSETSSQISNATNGIEPPRGHVSIKASKDGILKQVVPDYENLSDNYELLWISNAMMLLTPSRYYAKIRRPSDLRQHQLRSKTF